MIETRLRSKQRDTEDAGRVIASVVPKVTIDHKIIVCSDLDDYRKGRLGKKMQISAYSATKVCGFLPQMGDAVSNCIMGKPNQTSGTRECANVGLWKSCSEIANWCYRDGPKVLFTAARPDFIVASEQFWGRAVRASCDSLESGALLVFAFNTKPLT